MAPDEGLLFHHRRDTRTAVRLHALLVILLIVLWVADQRAGILAPITHWLLQRVGGGS